MYKYKVWRKNENVFYSINNGTREIVERAMVSALDLPFLYGLCSGEKYIGRLFEYAHKMAKEAIKNLEEHEQGFTGDT